MNLNQYQNSLMLDKFYGRNYGGRSAKDALIEGRARIVIQNLPSFIAESVSVSGIVGWFTEVKQQIDVLIRDVYSGEEHIVDILNNIQSAFANKHPSAETSPEEIKDDLDHIFHILTEYSQEVEGSLKQYVTQLSDTVKTISVDSIAPSENEETSSEEDGFDNLDGGGSAGGMGLDDDFSDEGSEDSGEDSEELDFDAELENL